MQRIGNLLVNGGSSVFAVCAGPRTVRGGEQSLAPAVTVAAPVRSITPTPFASKDTNTCPLRRSARAHTTHNASGSGKYKRVPRFG